MEKRLGEEEDQENKEREMATREDLREVKCFAFKMGIEKRLGEEEGQENE